MLFRSRRLHTVPILIILVVAVAALSSAALFSGGTRATFDDASAAPWQALLLTYTMMAAMTSPILTAVLASRQTEIEHSGSGWTLAATAGVSPGSLCRAKLMVLSIALAPTVIGQSLLVIAAGMLAGIRAPLDPGPWAGYTFWLLLVDIAFCAVHIWLAATVENQLISVGIGVLGAFLAVFLLLMPGMIARIAPWGYYAVISHAVQHDNSVEYTQPPLLWIVGFLVIIGAGFALGTHRLTRTER